MHDERENEVFVMVMDMATKRTRKRQRDDRDEAGICTCCGNEPQVKGRRGLGKLCWSRMDAKRRGMTPRQRARYEGQLIADGKMFASRQGQRVDVTDTFAQYAEAVR